MHLRIVIKLLVIALLAIPEQGLAARAFSSKSFSSVVEEASRDSVHTEKLCYAAPLKRKMNFSGNYAEFRENHFHGGLDFRVGGVEGDSIRSISDGYLSRILVSPDVYGNCLVIRHDDGHYSLYAHLLDFRKDIQEYLRLRQYEQQTYALSLALDSGAFRICKGDFIGRAGNTGRSMGPHLHLEIMNPDSSLILNPANFFEMPEDTRDPEIQRVKFYAFDDTLGVPFSKELYDVSAPGEQILRLPSRSYMSIAAGDRQNQSRFTFGIEKYTVRLDGEPIYVFEKGDIALAQTFFYHSIIDYATAIHEGKHLLSTYVGEAAPFEDKISSASGGLILLRDGKLHRLQVEVADLSGNKAAWNFQVRRDTTLDYQAQLPEYFGLYEWFQPFHYQDEVLELDIPALSMTESACIAYEKMGPMSYRIGEAERPLHLGAILSLKPDTVISALKDKYLLRNHRGKRSYSCYGKWKDDKYIAEIQGFGEYHLLVDTLAPSCRRVGKFAFQVKDNYAEMVLYQATIDGKWVLALYDPKNNLITLDSSAQVQCLDGAVLRLEVWDPSGNRRVKEYVF